MSLTSKPKLHIYVGEATHFLRWEIPEFSKYFELVDQPSEDAVLLSFGPDTIKQALNLPAQKRFATTFPGFGKNPLYNLEVKNEHLELLPQFDGVFINPGPLELAYKTLENIYFYPFSVDTDLVSMKKYRKRITSLLHLSSDAPQKDWTRSENIMEHTGMKFEVYPPRDPNFYEAQQRKNRIKNKIRRKLRIQERQYLPTGYVPHELVVKKYQQYDGFVHVAKDIQDQIYIDGKYTAALIEAGVTGSILFWHDTFSLGNGLETVFALSLEPEKAAQEIIDISKSINVEKHSKLTREEMLDTFNVQSSVRIRAKHIYDHLELGSRL